MKAIVENILCPLCLSSDRRFLSAYPGKFLCCKEVHQCNSCGLTYVFELPENEDLNNYYSNGLYYDQVVDPFNLEFLEFSKNLALTRLNLIKKETNVLSDKCKTLDIGAGNASFGIALQKISSNAIYDVVEPDIKVHESYGVEVNKHYSDITDVEGNNYDLVVLNQVLEHLPKPFQFIHTICELIKDQGVLYIDVPFKDYLFKQSVEPHILFLTPESLSYLIKKIGLELIFCDTVGMTHEKAKIFFHNKASLKKFRNPWMYANKIKQLARKFGFNYNFDTFRQFHADEYGGDRQWLRCVAKKIV